VIALLLNSRHSRTWLRALLPKSNEAGSYDHSVVVLNWVSGPRTARRPYTRNRDWVVATSRPDGGAPVYESLFITTVIFVLPLSILGSPQLPDLPLQFFVDGYSARRFP